MSDRRMRLSPDEIAIIEGLRQEKAIWNSAIDAAMTAFVSYPPFRGGDEVDPYEEILTSLIDLRK